MKDSLLNESEKLTRSWMQHEASWLRDYLVSGVEDPRLNLQSILTRHFLIRSLMGNRMAELMTQEYCFAALLNWLKAFARKGGGPEENAAVLHALRHHSDNAEGLEIPWLIVESFAQLPATAAGLTVPNYIERFLEPAAQPDGSTRSQEAAINTFCDLWQAALTRSAQDSPTAPTEPIAPGELPPALQRKSVLEPACGSANDYRFLNAYGLCPSLDYQGFDLCPKNVENARRLFPGVSFEVGNVFEIAASDKTFDFCIVHDLFEHLSIEGLQTAVQEICRVTRSGICAGFFQMDEIRDHIVRPVDDYHCNLLSMARTKELFAACGFSAQVIHIGTFVRNQLGCEETHNPNAYTFLLQASS